MKICIDYQTEKIIKRYEDEKKYLDERIKEYKTLLEIYENLSECYNDNLKELYKERIDRSWGKC